MGTDGWIVTGILLVVAGAALLLGLIWPPKDRRDLR
jgi:hypothetical protein